MAVVNLTQNFDVYVNPLGRSDTINGLSGDDIISGRDGNDVIDGGAGFDIANYMDDYEAKGIKGRHRQFRHRQGHRRVRQYRYADRHRGDDGIAARRPVHGRQ